MKRKQRIIYGALLILWMIVIWGFSAVPGEASMEMSGCFAGPLARFLQQCVMGDADESARLAMIAVSQFLIRKGAHFVEYAVLGALFYLFGGTFSIRPLGLWAAIASFACACADELHQLISGTRSGLIRDVVWDTVGAAAGILLIWIVLSLLALRKLRKQQNAAPQTRKE